ncbi:MAG: hypothetical protein AAF918_09895 [Pseudomonadota bacterium]
MIGPAAPPIGHRTQTPRTAPPGQALNPGPEPAVAHYTNGERTTQDPYRRRSGAAAKCRTHH